jgi:RNA polymerase sigma-70 factor (ECF subfamily)
MSGQREPPTSNPPFATTHWSVVAAAGGSSSAQSRAALTILCTTYWYPLYAFVRRRGYAADEAQDLTQEFFAQLLEKKSLQAADPHRGRFRSFLLASFDHFLANQRRKARAAKRGGNRVVLSLDFDAGESQYRLEPSHQLTPEVIFERRWAMTVLEQAVGKLQQEYEQAGKGQQFQVLKVYLGGEAKPPSYRQVCAELEMTEGAAKVAVHRLRRRCRELLRAEIAQTVATAEEVDQELRDLFATLG